MFLKSLITILLLLITYRTILLVRNYRIAKQIGLPIVITPLSWQDPPWILLASHFEWLKYLPGPLFSWYNYSYLAFVTHDGFKTCARLNTRAYTVVAPSKNEIVVGDPEAIAEVMGNWKKWQRPRALYSIFSSLGENVNSSLDWQRHRKIISQGFRETDKKAWQVGLKQARQWLDTLNCDGTALRIVAESCDSISGNVLMSAGFGQDYEFTATEMQDMPKGHTKTFSELMHYMMRNILLAWVTNDLNLPSFLEWKGLTQLNLAKKELHEYFEEILESRSGNFVKAMLEANESEKEGGREHLSRSELHGNMYILQLAGYDTTSFSMLYSIAMLSTRPDIQDWVRETLVRATDYESAFPASVRCRAVQYETLRYYGIVPDVARESNKTESLIIAGKEYVIPPYTFVAMNSNACHHDPELWGPDVEVWNPKRFIEVVDGEEHLKTPSYLLPWSTGSRGCPGKKFSQVEFTAVITSLLRDYKLEGSPGLQEALEDFVYTVTPKIREKYLDRVSIKFERCSL